MKLDEGTNSDDKDFVHQATQMTAANLRHLTTKSQEDSTATSQLSIPEREELIQLISEILPAGNVVSFVFNGIRSLKDREISSSDGRTHLSSLFKGLSIVRDNAFYRMMFAGPATVLAGYNMLLKLAGAQPEHFLPDGAWQFYLEFGLREDTARHSNETLGFHRLMRQLRVSVSEVDALSAWILAVMWLLRDYNELLAMVWEEHIRLRVMEDTAGLVGLHRLWGFSRPFDFPEGFSGLMEYRRRCFDQFCDQQFGLVGVEQRQRFFDKWGNTDYQSWRSTAVRSYQQQMSLHSYLEPGEYNEQRIFIRRSELSVAVIVNGVYFLVGFTDPRNAVSPALVRGHVAAMFEYGASPSELDLNLVLLPRSRQIEVRGMLSGAQHLDLQALQSAPIIINWDQQYGRKSLLSVIRQQRRGVGDHSLTLFSTGESMVFDFSHIYFDGSWAMEISEILTRQATRQLKVFASEDCVSVKPVSSVVVQFPKDSRFRHMENNLPHIVPGVSAEVSFDLSPILDLKQLFIRKTKPTVLLTVNDLLVLYRTVFNQCYRVNPQLYESLEALRRFGLGNVVDPLGSMFLSLRDVNPSLLMLVDASWFDPRSRLFPCTFRSPFVDLLSQHREVLNLMNSVAKKHSRKDDSYLFFDKSRLAYLGMLSGFGEVMRRYRMIAADGQSMSTTAIRLLAGLPGAMQRLVDGIPGRFSFMNEAIKGEEVFSNVGRVVSGSSISRFMSAKDDNDKKVLVWGIMTDDTNRLCISLRDFRPQVLALVSVGHRELAYDVTRDFLHSYASGFLDFVGELNSIVQFSGT